MHPIVYYQQKGSTMEMIYYSKQPTSPGFTATCSDTLCGSALYYYRRSSVLF